jgi:hypothetical protein
VQEALVDVLDVAVLCETVVNVRARRVAFTHKDVIEEHALATERHRMPDNGAVSDDTNGDGGRHGSDYIEATVEGSSGDELTLSRPRNRPLFCVSPSKFSGTAVAFREAWCSKEMAGALNRAR